MRVFIVSRKKSIKSRLGKCYQLAGRYVVDHKKAILVHGTINGARVGVNFDNPHAWVEENGEVYDLVMGDRLPKEVYFHLMGAKEIKRYTHNQTRRMLVKHKNWGAW